MQCPKCGVSNDAELLWTRPLSAYIVRGHQCLSCQWKFESHQVVVPTAQPHKVQAYDPIGLEPVPAVQNTTAHSAATPPAYDRFAGMTLDQKLDILTAEADAKAR